MNIIINCQQLGETTGKSPDECEGRLLSQGLTMGATLLCVCVTVYLQGSIFAEGGHTLHKTTHLVRNRFNDFRQNPRDQVLRDCEDLRGDKNQLLNARLDKNNQRRSVHGV